MSRRSTPITAQFPAYQGPPMPVFDIQVVVPESRPLSASASSRQTKTSSQLESEVAPAAPPAPIATRSQNKSRNRGGRRGRQNGDTSWAEYQASLDFLEGERLANAYKK